MPRKETKQVLEDAWLALLLAWIAGSVDAIGYLTLAHLFTAHMSGNTAALGAYLGSAKWAEASKRALPIPLFVAGVAGGYALAEVAKRRGARSPFAPVFGVQAGLLVLFMVWGSLRLHDGALRPDGAWEYVLLVALPSLAMGVQNSTLRRVGNQNVRTTYISGMLTNFAEQCVELLLWLRDHLRDAGKPRRRRVWRVISRQPALRRALLFSGIWCAFVVGALIGAAALQRWELRAVLLPLIGVLTAMAVDRAHPIAMEPLDARKPRQKSAGRLRSRHEDKVIGRGA